MKIVSVEKRLTDKSVEECNDNNNEKKLHPNKKIYNSTLNNYEKYVVLVNAVLA